MSMEVQVAETGPCSRSLTITVPPPLVDEHLDQMYRSAQQQAQVKGFRPGKVPKAIIEKKYGPAILAEAKEQLLNRYFGEACRDQEINPVGQVEIDDFEKLEVRRGAMLQFVARVDVRPQVELKELKGIEVDAFEPEATDEDVDNALKEIAHERRKMQKTDEPAADGDFVKADLTFVDEAGDKVRERKNAQLNTRTPIHGCSEEAWTAAVIGVTAGKQAEIDVVFPDNFEVEAVRGKPGKVRLDVHEIQRVTPAPIDDELARSLGLDDLAALREHLRERISAEKARAGRQQQEAQCIDWLLQNHAVELPPSMVEQQQKASLAGFEERIRESGASDEDVAKQLQAAQGDALQDAEKRVRLFFLIEAVAQKEGVTVTDADVDRELMTIAEANDATPLQVRQHLEENDRFGELRLALLERKVRDFLRENARPVDKKGS